MLSFQERIETRLYFRGVVAEVKVADEQRAGHWSGGSNRDGFDHNTVFGNVLMTRLVASFY